VSCADFENRFYYAECQFDVLKRCPWTKNYLDKCLRSFPLNLDETYELILCGIDEGCVHDVRRILTLLSFSNRPLREAELAGAYAFEIYELYLKPENRPLDNDSINEMRQGLVETSAKEGERTKQPANLIARIFHISVQKYLESDRIGQHKALSFSLKSESRHAIFSQVCFVYLLQMRTCKRKQDGAIIEFPLAHYATESRCNRYGKAAELRSDVNPLVLELFEDSKGSFEG
jgi:hypothetical protein